MNGIPPIVRYMIVCDDVVSHSALSTKPLIVGLTTYIRASIYPFVLRKLCVLLVMTDGRGKGTAKLRLVDDATNHLLVEFQHSITFPKNPLTVTGLPWRLNDLRFPKGGMYRIEFWYDGSQLAHQLLEAR